MSFRERERNVGDLFRYSAHLAGMRQWSGVCGGEEEDVTRKAKRWTRGRV